MYTGCTLNCALYTRHTLVYTGHTLDCTLHSGMCPWTVHQVYTGLYTRCVQMCIWLCTRCVQLCPRYVFGLCARCVQLCSRCAFGLYANCVQMWPAVFQLCIRCALDVCWTVHYWALDCTPLYTVHWIVHTVCTPDIHWMYTGLCTTAHWTVRKFKQVPAWCFWYIMDTHPLNIYICKMASSNDVKI